MTILIIKTLNVSKIKCVGNKKKNLIGWKIQASFIYRQYETNISDQKQHAVINIVNKNTNVNKMITIPYLQV